MPLVTATLNVFHSFGTIDTTTNVIMLITVAAETRATAYLALLFHAREMFKDPSCFKTLSDYSGSGIITSKPYWSSASFWSQKREELGFVDGFVLEEGEEAFRDACVAHCGFILERYNAQHE